MPRNRSEKLPGFTKNWSDEGVHLCEAFGMEIADTLPVDHVETVRTGNWTCALPNSIHLFVGQAQRDYNRRRSQSYALIAHFFEKAHAAKQK